MTPPGRIARARRLNELYALRSRVSAEIIVIEKEIEVEAERPVIIVEAEMKRRRRRKAECGTDSGYHHHRRQRKEEACEACRLAHAAAERDRARRASA